MLFEEETLAYLWPSVPRCALAPSGWLPYANIWAFQKGGQGPELHMQQLLPPIIVPVNTTLTSVSSPPAAPGKISNTATRQGCIKRAQPREFWEVMGG